MPSADSGARNRLVWLVGAIAVGTAIAIIILWPGEADTVLSEGLTGPSERAEVTAVTYSPCPPPQPGDPRRH